MKRLLRRSAAGTVLIVLLTAVLTALILTWSPWQGADSEKALDETLAPATATASPQVTPRATAAPAFKEEEVIALTRGQVVAKRDGPRPEGAAYVVCIFATYHEANHLWVVVCFFYDANNALIGSPTDPWRFTFDDDTGRVIWP